MRRTSAGRRSRRWQCGGDADATAEGVEPVPTGRGPAAWGTIAHASGGSPFGF